MTADERRRRRAWMEVLVAPLVAVGFLCLCGWKPTQAGGGHGAMEAMFLALSALLAVLYATLLPIMRRMVHAGSLDRLRLAFRAAGQRFILTLLIAGTIAWLDRVDRRVFLVWIAIGYVVLSLVETIALVRWMRKTEKRACT
ncbi:MAG TPA: hypothetical protein PL151_05160 [Phycisphaerae bacterium]|nr:hypothetical protein [Phycisphaerae bacterium]HOJ74792.1 hypothetical protein [Phycisphaerae bacterium]HOM51955.1 hypothetical protein [Phycisphaerae bacterium]HPP27421.1 hypothetical protein [Phycisphaerae bacterium]HPU25691.1 hypothetical protein [Phycisphaerae bacterium]